MMQSLETFDLEKTRKTPYFLQQKFRVKCQVSNHFVLIYEWISSLPSFILFRHSAQFCAAASAGPALPTLYLPQSAAQAEVPLLFHFVPKKMWDVTRELAAHAVTPDSSSAAGIVDSSGTSEEESSFLQRMEIPAAVRVVPLF